MSSILEKIKERSYQLMWDHLPASGIAAGDEYLVEAGIKAALDAVKEILPNDETITDGE